MERWLYLRPREGRPARTRLRARFPSSRVDEEDLSATGICACLRREKALWKSFLKGKRFFFARSIISHAWPGSLNENLKFLPGNMTTDGDIETGAQHLREDLSKALYAPMTL